ncbi:MAG: hypothetical protein U5L11_03335 [Arhodomonas sp.]|nr:hypothetical protein [Arhodomonas sp.]
MNAYALTDRGTWLSFNNRQDLQVLDEGDEILFNEYGSILSGQPRAPRRPAHRARADLARMVDFPEGQQRIASFRG